MIRISTLALVLGMAGAQAAEAGAWLREKGKGFSSVSIQTTEDNGNSASFYMEYGLTEGMTLGLDTTYDTDLLNYPQGQALQVQSVEELPEGSGILFLRFPIGPTDRTDKFAFHVGIGARYIDGEFLEAGELGLSWGRGIKFGERWGWVNVDGSYNEARAPAETRIKLDATVGLGLTKKTKVMLQMFNTFSEGETYSKIAPSLLYSLGQGKATLQLGSEILIDTGEASLKIGFWFDF